jgi:NADH dehydrogenase/putative oxidoreductase
MLQQNVRQVRQEFGPWRQWIIHAARLHALLWRSVATAIWPVADLLLRLWIANGFLASAVHRMMAAPQGVMLTHPEQILGWLSPVIAVGIVNLIEVGGAVLLIVGLLTRSAAVVMMLLAFASYFTQQAADRPLLAGVLLGWYAFAGAGTFSLDQLLAGISRSAVPFAAALARLGEHVRTRIAPVYLLALRVWLAVSLANAGLVRANDVPGQALGVLMNGLPHLSAPPLAPALALVMAVMLATGTATRYVAITLIIQASIGVMMGHGLTGALYWLPALVPIALQGPGLWSVDRALRAWLGQRYPEILGLPAFALADVPRVVIVGAGFGGLSCAAALRRSPVAVTLIDRANHYLFQPLLYQVATAGLSPGDIAAPIRPLFRDSFNTEVLFGTVTGIDTVTRQVQLGTKRVGYDYLVLATGATHGYFGKDAWREHAPGLKRIEDATEIRRRLLVAFEYAEAAEDPADRAALLTFLIVGGGPTGVELAGAIAELTRYGMHKDFRRFDPASAHIILVQSGPRVLPAFPERLSAIARRSLEQLGVDVRTDSRVEHIDGSGVRIDGQLIAARTVLWAAGVVASPAGRWLGAASDSAGRIKVDPELKVPGCANVYAIGDTAASDAWGGKPVPGLAPAAKQGGRYVAAHIIARATGQSPPPPFVYHHAGSLATIGRKAAVVDLGRMQLWGAPAWWLWGLVHVGFLVGVRNRVAILVNWFWAYLTFRSAIRLITSYAEGTTDSMQGSAVAERSSGAVITR